jgi:hypothetical protein
LEENVPCGEKKAPTQTTALKGPLDLLTDPTRLNSVSNLPFTSPQNKYFAIL